MFGIGTQEILFILLIVLLFCRRSERDYPLH